LFAFKKKLKFCLDAAVKTRIGKTEFPQSSETGCWEKLLQYFPFLPKRDYIKLSHGMVVCAPPHARISFVPMVCFC
jgi:hypothetical protein